MKNQDFIEKEIPELEQRVEKTRDRMRVFRFDIAARKMRNHRACRVARKELAMMLTALQEKKNK